MQMPEKTGEQVPFDVERDITKKDWEQMLSHLENSRGPGLSKYYKMFAYMSLLQKDKLPPISEKAGGELSWEIETSRNFGTWDIFFDTVWAAHVLQADMDESITLSGVDRDQIASIIEKSEDDEKWSEAMQYLYKLQMIDPKGEWGNFEHHIVEGSKSWAHNAPSNTMETSLYIRFVACMRIVRPEVELRIPQAMWNQSRTLLDFYRMRGQWDTFAEYAWYMKLAAADEVRLNEDRQIEITSQKRLPAEDRISPMPDTLAL
jgi:hypothetical protein